MSEVESAASRNAKREGLTVMTLGAHLPPRCDGVEELDAFLAGPSQPLINDLATLEGDIIVVGGAGKMGPTLARLARNAAPAVGGIALSRSFWARFAAI